MTDEPETPETGDDEAPATSAVAVAERPAEGDAAVVLAESDEPNAFWTRPHVERYLVPFLLPFLIVAGIVFFVLDVSRIFLAGEDKIAVGAGIGITLLILIGATVLSNAPRMRTSSVGIATAALVVAVLGGGWLSVGDAAGKKDEGSAALDRDGGSIAQLAFESTNDLKFIPSDAETESGIVQITLNNSGGQHTFTWDNVPDAAMAPIEAKAGGDVVAARAFLGTPGDYTFYCATPGHRAAGMEGTVTVTGAAKTRAEAEAEVAGAASTSEADAAAGS